MNHLSPARIVVGVILGIAAVQALMVFAFSWPASNSGPRELPVAVAGPPEAIGQITQGLESAPSPDEGTSAFDVITVDDQAAAEEAIRDRDVYGAVVVSEQGPQLLVATGAGPAVAQLLRSGVTELAGGGQVPPVEDIVPTDEDDPNGAGLASGVLPLIMTSAGGGAAAAILLRRAGHRLSVVIGLSTVAGFAGAAILQYALGVVDTSYLALSGIIGLIVGGVAAGVSGLGSLLGRAGAVLGILLMIFVANPMSGATSAPEMLPQPWGEIGQWLPPGAGVNAVRSVVYFDNAGLTEPLIVLGAWVVGGLLLIVIGSLLWNRRDAATYAVEADDVPADASLAHR